MNTPTKLHTNQKGFAPILIVFIAAVLIGGYLLYQKPSKPASQPTTLSKSTPTLTPESTNSAEIANWKTYINTKYGFEIKHPIEAIIHDGMADPTISAVLIILPRQSDQDANPQLRISIADNPKSKSVKDFCLSRWDSNYSIIDDR